METVSCPPVWRRALAVIACCAALSLAVSAFLSPLHGALSFAAALLVLVLMHVVHLVRLRDWAVAGQLTRLPQAHGVWAPVMQVLDVRVRALRDRQDALTVALERFRTASQAMPDGVIYLSGQDTIEWINQKAEQHFGLSQARDLGCPLAGLVRQPELMRYLEYEEQDEPLVITSPRRPGLRLLIQLVPFGSDQRMLVSRDITQIEKLETMRRDFIANVSHELRTPLTVVGGFVETVMDGLDDLEREDVLRFLNLALEQSTRMQRLIEDLLALSALETGAPAPSEEKVDIPELVRTVHQEAQLLSAGRHELVLELDQGDEGDIVLGSQKELHSAFANLASNAVRYTPAGGRIVIGWHRGIEGGEFSVQDNGIGIDPRHINRLTERFFRVDRGRSRETGGTGLGLAIVKHIVSRHQAELMIESEPGKGSRFCVRFPEVRLRKLRSPVQS